jgi:hypothetical protein
MLLGRSRLKRSVKHLVVDLKLSFNERVEAVSYFLNERSVKCRSNSFIDSSNSFILEISEGQDIEMSLETGRNNRATTAGRSHGG